MEATVHSGLDRRDLADIHRSLVEESSTFLKVFHQYIRGQDDEYALRVERIDRRQCIGMISIYRSDGDYLYVGAIWIDPEFRGRGLGKSLFKQAVLMSAKKDRRSMRVDINGAVTEEVCGFKRVEVNAYTPEKVAMWEKNGFRPIDFIESKGDGRSWTRLALSLYDLE